MCSSAMYKRRMVDDFFTNEIGGARARTGRRNRRPRRRDDIEESREVSSRRKRGTEAGALERNPRFCARAKRERRKKPAQRRGHDEKSDERL